MSFSVLKPAIVLFLFTAVSALIVGFMHTITYEPIAEQALRREQEAVASLIPLSQANERIAIDLPQDITVYRVDASFDAGGDILGYVFFAASPGYSGAVRLLVGFEPDGTVLGVRVISHTETPGLGSVIAGAPFINQFDGLIAPIYRVMNPQGQNEIAHIAGATMSVDAVLRAVNEAWEIFSQEIGGR